MGKLQGFPLKIVTETNIAEKKGKPKKSTSTTVVTLLREEDVEPSRFTWPEDYTEVSFVPATPDMPNVDLSKRP